MKFGCFSLDFKRFSLETAFKIAAGYGFDGIELWGGRPHAYPFDMDHERISKVKELKTRYSLEIPMYTPNAIGMPYCLCSLDPDEQKDALEYFKRAIEACEGIEVPRMLIVADHPGYEVSMRKSKERFIENVRILGDFANRHSVILVIEALTPMESPVITTSDDLVEIIEDIGLDNIEAMLDVVPPNIAYEPYSAYFEKLGDRLHYIHLCNNDGRTDAHLRLDTGCLPVEDILEIAKNRKYEDYITVELYSECYKDPELLLANSSRILKRARNELNI